MSDPTLVVVLAVAGAILLVAYLADRSARSGTPPKQLETETAEPLHPLVRELGLTKLDAGEIRGEIEGARVRVLLASSPVNFSVSLDGVPSDLNLVEEPGVLFRRLGSADMATGDLGFDDAIRVAGPHDEALAVLTAETRHAVQYEIVRHSFVVEHGEVRWAARAFTSGDELVEIVRAAITLAKRLRLDRTETASRLANNLTAESVPGVRVRLLQTLGLVFPEHAETQRAARRAAVDPVVAVRIAAANIASGPQAVTLLKALALDPAADDESRAAALAGITGKLPSDELREVLHPLLQAGSSLAVAALRAAAADGWRPPTARLLPLLEAVHPDARAAAARAVDASEPGAEAKLLTLLENNERPVMLAAMESLGRSAGLSAVETLLPHTSAFGEIGRAARTAIADIQARNPGASGGLALADEPAESGQVSLATSQRGAVALADKKPRGGGTR